MSDASPYPPISNDCLDCGVDVKEIGDYCMLQLDVWLEAHPARHGVLCLDCIERRLGRPLRQRDFNDMPLNSWAPLGPRIQEIEP